MKKFLSIIAVAILAIGIAPAVPANAAGGYLNADICGTKSLPFWTGTTKIICYDITARRVYIQNWSDTGINPSLTLLASGGTTQILDNYFDQPLPTVGYWLSDSYCNAVNTTKGLETRFTVGTQYNLNGKTVKINQNVQAPGLADVWSEATVSPTLSDQVAWYANSASGYACVIMP